METNYTMLKKLNKEFNPKDRGIVHADEIWQIKKGLCLGERTDILDLRNLRDFTVMFFSIEMDRAEVDGMDKVLALQDKMSAIVSVIDDRIWNLGGEV